MEYTFKEIANKLDLEIEAMEIDKEHVHLFLSFPPRYGITKVVGMLKARSAKEVFDFHPEVDDKLWGGKFWEDGYFARTVGDKVTEESD